MQLLFIGLFILAISLPIRAYIHHKPGFMLATDWQANSAEQQNIDHYFVSEKFDGIRLLFDGKHFISRSGNVILTPPWFSEPLKHPVTSEVKLDGELWLGRGQFNELNRLLLRQDFTDPLWQQVRFKVFDLVLPNMAFIERKQQLQQRLSVITAQWIEAVHFSTFTNYTEFEHFYQHLLVAGGEGVMLIKQQARYRSGRVLSLKKYKPSFDAEATVIGYQAGKGKYKNKVGSLIVRDQQQRQFNIGSGLTDQLRQQPPAIGQRITFKHSGLSKNGIPRFPRFLREYTAF